MLTAINPILRESVLSHLKQAVDGLYKIDVTIYSKENSDISITPLYFSNLIIAQVFTYAYTDVIQLNCELSPTDLLSLLENTQDLYCTITMFPFREAIRDLDPDADPVVYTFQAIVSNLEDLLKKYNINQLIKTENNIIDQNIQGLTIPVGLELLTEDTYDLRHTPFTTMLQNCTVSDAIYCAAGAMHIDNVFAIKPNNTKIYKTISFPPMVDISSAFDLLHDRYGIYTKGMEYYYTNKTLYIYPGYDSTPDRTDPIVHIYKIPDNTLPGMYSYHHVDDEGNLHIVCDATVESIKHSEINAENEGNQIIALRSDTALDFTREVQGTTGKFTGTNLLTCGLISEKTAKSSMTNTKYTSSSNNAFKLASDIYKNNCISLTSSWKNAVPFIIVPGQRCIYHYEDESGYKTLYGIVDQIIYEFLSNSRLSYTLYSARSVFTLRLDPQEQSA